MIPIADASVSQLEKFEPDTVVAVLEQPEGLLLHSRWFAFLIPTDKLKAKRPSTVPAEHAENWGFIVWPSESGFKKAQPMVKKVVGADGAEEVLVQFLTNSPSVTAYMNGPVFDWIQAHFDDPEFWVRGVDLPIAIKEDGKLIGGVGPARLAST